MSSTNNIKVLMAMHPGFDVMDFFGPLEILSLGRTVSNKIKSTSTSNAAPPVFEIVATGPEHLMITDPGVKVASQLDLQEAYGKLADFDILIIPGGSSAVILKSEAQEPMKLIKAFASLPPRSSSQRVIMSVCTGALFLAKAGVLKGQTVTTNSQHLEQLRHMVPASETTVVKQKTRFVVNPCGGVKGVGLDGYRIITSAGPGAGLDLSMWLLEHYLGEEVRTSAEDLMEYQGRPGDGLIVG